MSPNEPTPATSASPEPLDTGHDYDGIREYDNRLPNWWVASLLIAIVFGYGYWFYYHEWSGGQSSLEQYYAEMDLAAERAAEAAKAGGVVTDASLVAMSTSPTVIQKGAARFKQTCAVCHGAQGQGVIGPNLTDNYWLHGDKPTDILHTVTNGVADKGMPSWGPVLGDQEVRTVVAYVLTLKGKNVPGRPPQGTPVVVTAAGTASAATTTTMAP